jgi:hypothetical protein
MLGEAQDRKPKGQSSGNRKHEGQDANEVSIMVKGLGSKAPGLKIKKILVASKHGGRVLPWGCPQVVEVA